MHYEKFDNGTVKCIEEEIPFDEPEGWSWVRLGDIGQYKKGPFGSSITKAMFVPDSPTAVKVYEQKNAINKDDSLGNYFISEEKYQSLRGFEVFPNDIIVSCAGTIGETYVLPKGMRKGIINQALMKISLYDLGMLEFYLVYFDFQLKASAQEHGHGIALKNIPPFDVLKKYLMPVPPLQEQSRIIRELASILQLLNAIDADRADISDLITRTKEKVLDLAIRGKLVPQNPEDEPAAVLVERIRAEKEMRIKQGTIKRDKRESIIFRGDDNSYYEKVGEAVSCIDELIPFELPEGRAWVRGYSCFSGMESKRPAGVDFDYIDIDSIDNRNHVITEPKHMAVHDAPSRASRAVRAGSVLFSLVRPYLQNIAYIPEEYSSCIASTGFYVCNSSGALIPEFMFYLMLSPYVVNGLNQFMKGDNSPSISKDDIENWLYPIPPIAEQKRIVIHVQKALEQTSLIASSLS